MNKRYGSMFLRNILKNKYVETITCIYVQTYIHLRNAAQKFIGIITMEEFWSQNKNKISIIKLKQVYPEEW